MPKSAQLPKSDPIPARPTIHEVARRSGLSVGTVSRILNGGNKANWASTAAREEKVRKIAREIGYRPNYRAHSLRSQRSHTIGLVYGRAVPMLDGAYESIAKAVVEVLSKRGYQMLFLPLPQNDQDSWPMEVLDKDRIDGCLGMDPLPKSVVELVRQRGLPMVVINADAEASQVLPDDVEGTRRAIDYLTGLGHTRICFVHPYYPDGGHFSLSLRRKVFLEEMKKRRLSASAQVLEGTPEDFINQYQNAPADRRPTAVLSYCGTLAMALHHAIWAARISVPSQLSLMTFDDLPAMRWLTPAMTAINVPIDEIGKRAAELILSCVADKQTLPTDAVYFPESLVIRQSTGVAPA